MQGGSGSEKELKIQFAHRPCRTPRLPALVLVPVSPAIHPHSLLAMHRPSVNYRKQPDAFPYSSPSLLTLVLLGINANSALPFPRARART